MSDNQDEFDREEALLDEAQRRPLMGRLGIYTRLSGPGWLQGAITLGGGSLTGALYIAVIAGYGMLWLQPLAMVMGVIMLSAIGYVTLSTGERPFQSVKTHISPLLAWGWVLATVIANIVWSMPQFTLGTAAVQQNLFPGLMGLEFDSTMVICVVMFGLALAVNFAYESGYSGVKAFEWILKSMVGLIVVSFILVVGVLAYEGNLPGGEIFRGFVPNFGALFVAPESYEVTIQQTGEYADFWRNKIVDMQRDRVMTAFATAVGINMTFLLPYTMLRKRWGVKHRGLAIFDLSLGLIVPFVLATSCVVIAAAAGFHGQTGDVLDEQGVPRGEMAGSYYRMLGGHVAAPVLPEGYGEMDEVARAAAVVELRAGLDDMPEADRRLAAMLVNRDSFQLANALSPLTGPGIAQKVFGVGVLGMALSTIIILMLMNGFAFCEIFNRPGHRGVHLLGCVVSGVGGLFGPFVWASDQARMALAVPASVIGGSFIPIAYFTFFLMMNSKSLLGESLPRGGRRLRWNILMVLTLGLATFAVVWTILGRLRVEMAGWGFEQGVAIIGLVLLVVMFLVGAVNFVRKNRIRA